MDAEGTRSGGQRRGGRARGEAGAGWGREVPGAVVVVPPLRALQRRLRPEGSDPGLGGGRALRRTLVLVLAEGPLLLCLACFHPGRHHAEFVATCWSPAQQVWRRGLPAAVLCASVQYASSVLRYSAQRQNVELSLELLPPAVFMPVFGTLTAGLLAWSAATLAWAVPAMGVAETTAVWGLSLALELGVVWPALLLVSALAPLDFAPNAAHAKEGRYPWWCPPNLVQLVRSQDSSPGTGGDDDNVDDATPLTHASNREFDAAQMSADPGTGDVEAEAESA